VKVLSNCATQHYENIDKNIDKNFANIPQAHLKTNLFPLYIIVRIAKNFKFFSLFFLRFLLAG